MGTKLAVECADYFRVRPGWKRPLEAVWKKFRSTGRAGGVVRIPDPSPEECQAVSQLLARPAAPPELKFSLRELEQALGETRFAGVGLHELLEAYFNKPLVSRRDTAELRRLQRRDFFQAARDAAAPESTRSWIPDWISAMEEQKTCGYQMVIRELEAAPEKAAHLLQTVCKGLAFLESQETLTAVEPDQVASTRQAAASTASLPFTRLRLAVFSAQVTADPHFFDRQNVAGKLLLHGLAFWKGRPFPVSSEETLELYYAAGLIPDSISSFTAQIGLRLYPVAESGVGTEEGPTEAMAEEQEHRDEHKAEHRNEHPAYRYFREHGEEMLLSLSELYRIDGADSPSGVVFVVENQMVFSQLCETARNVGASMVCTSGQMKTASLYLLDLLAAAGCELRYSGDFDPEGLVIADRLLTRYPDQMALWHMGVDDYRMLTPGGTLGIGRMAMLERLKSPELLAVAEEMLKKGTAAYQELLLDVLEQDMKESK